MDAQARARALQDLKNRRLDAKPSLVQSQSLGQAVTKPAAPLTTAQSQPSATAPVQTSGQVQTQVPAPLTSPIFTQASQSNGARLNGGSGSTANGSSLGHSSLQSVVPRVLVAGSSPVRDDSIGQATQPQPLAGAQIIPLGQTLSQGSGSGRSTPGIRRSRENSQEPADTGEERPRKKLASDINTEHALATGPVFSSYSLNNGYGRPLSASGSLNGSLSNGIGLGAPRPALNVPPAPLSLSSIPASYAQPMQPMQSLGQSSRGRGAGGNAQALRMSFGPYNTSVQTISPLPSPRPFSPTYSMPSHHYAPAPFSSNQFTATRPHADSMHRMYAKSSAPVPAPAGKVRMTAGQTKVVPNLNAAASAALQATQRKGRNEESSIYKRTFNTEAIPMAGVAPRPVKPQTSKINSDESEGEETGSSSEDDSRRRASKNVVDEDLKALEWFNTASEADMGELLAITLAQQASIVRMRPIPDLRTFKEKLRNVKGLSVRIIEQYQDLMRGYNTIDSVLKACEEIGRNLSSAVGVWQQCSNSAAASRSGSPAPVSMNDDSSDADITDAMVGLNLNQMFHFDSTDVAAVTDAKAKSVLRDFIFEQPEQLENVTMKGYQLMGLNWLNLLHSQGHSGILADEMGLGKTLQVIAFLCHLKYSGVRGPHLVVVPSSTLENWMREFHRFAPKLNVAAYYGDQKSRAELREELAERKGDVIVTTYKMAEGERDGEDRRFLRKLRFHMAIFDEGHVLKNSQSKKYQNLIRIGAEHSLLLTGTPIQNNLQELISLLNFILPKIFEGAEEDMRAVFKVKGNTQNSLLSRQRILRAKKLMMPFVLRRKKAQVLTDLPPKIETVEYCQLTTNQEAIYKSCLKRSKTSLKNNTTEEPKKMPALATSHPTLMTSDSSSHILMDLRKAANHSMLFRRRFDDQTIMSMASDLLTTAEFYDRNLALVIEDMSVMTDSELQNFSGMHEVLHKYRLEDDVYLDSGKVTKLLKILEDAKAAGERVLIFSQFVLVLDILKIVFNLKGIKHMVLTGGTAVDERQSMVDEFTQDSSYQCFLLSTKAGGMGINLTAANVVVIFDADWNPHADKQAMDRAYRIGQQKAVKVHTLIAQGTIEEDMLELGNTKLRLDSAVQGLEAEEELLVKKLRASILSKLRDQAGTHEDGDDVLGAVHNVSEATMQQFTQAHDEKKSLGAAIAMQQIQSEM